VTVKILRSFEIFRTSFMPKGTFFFHRGRGPTMRFFSQFFLFGEFCGYVSQFRLILSRD